MSEAGPSARRRRGPAETGAEMGAKGKNGSAKAGPQDAAAPLSGQDAATHAHERKLLLFLIVFRLFNAVVLRTWFVPDEYWQSMEVAHRWVYGRGYVTWEWIEHIRSTLHPLLFAVLYKGLQLASVDSPDNLILAPRLLQAMFCAVGDLYTYKLALKLFGATAAKWALWCSVVSWFTFYCGPRTLANSLETVLCVVALYLWAWPGIDSVDRSQVRALSVAAIACVIRPTAAILWIFMAVHYLVHTSVPFRFVGAAVVVGCACLFLWACVDRWAFGEWILVQYEFLRFNIFRDVAAFYGTEPWHWYFTQGLPVIATTSLPLFVVGAYLARTTSWVPAGVVLWVVSVYSLLAHKEFRFIFPVLPVMHACSGIAMAAAEGRGKLALGLLLAVVLAVNVPMAAYFATIHQQGTLAAVLFLREQFEAEGGPSQSSMRAHYWMPCHSTPFYSHLHYDLPMRFLTCHPNETKGYIDEADWFFLDPSAFISAHYRDCTDPAREAPACDRAHGFSLQGVCEEEPDSWCWPSHIVMYDVLWPKVEPQLAGKGYAQCARFFHTHFPEGRVGRNLVVACR